MSLALFAPARGDVVFPVPTEMGSGVTIKISSPVTSVPHFGFLPVRVSVENLTTHDGTWRFRFDAGMPRTFPGVASTTFELSAPATQTREAWFYVPIAGPGVSVNAGALMAGSGVSSAQLPTAPPMIPGVYPDPKLPGVTYDEKRNITSTSAGLMRTFTITQTGPASALPPVSPSRLPPRSTTSITPQGDGATVTRTTVIPVFVNAPGSFGGAGINPSMVAMTNARQELAKAGFLAGSARTSSSVNTANGPKPGTQEITVTIRQTGPASTLPLPPLASLPNGFTAVNVVPEPGSPGNVTREFTYVETVSPAAPSPGSAVLFPVPRSLTASDVQVEARKVLDPAKLLDVPPTVKTGVSVQYVSVAQGSTPGPTTTYPLAIFEQTFPTSALPAPTAALPAGVKVTVMPSKGGTVTRIVSYIDPALITAVYNAASAATGPTAVAAQATNAARMELQRLGFLRPQPGVTVGPATTRSSGAPGAPSPDVIIMSETGPSALLAAPSPLALPTGLTCNVTPGALPGEVARNFVVSIPAFLAAASAPASTPLRPMPPGVSPRMSSTMNIANLLTIDVAGPGVPRNGRVTFPNATSTTAMAPLATSPALEQVVRGKFSSSGSRSPPNVMGFEVGQVPADWRLWSSFNAALLTTEEFDALDGARRAALRTWVATGGMLFLSPETAGDARTERLGAGRIEVLSEPIADVQPAEVFTRLQLGSFAPGMPDRDRLTLVPGSPMGEAVKFEPVDTLWLSLFLVAFAALVGPVNVLWLAPATRRHRLFFTTPIISIVGAAAVAGAIVLQDGLGGQGARRTLVWLVPGESQAAVFQEQGARSGFLTRRDFPLDDGVLCAVLPVDGNVYTFSLANSLFQREHGRAAGDWFANRSRQAQLLRTLAPTRARIELVGTAADGAPIVESTLATELRDFRLRDAEGRTWSAGSVPTGRRVPLRAEVGGVAPDANANGTPNLGALIRDAGTLTEPWQWIASGGATELAPIATLRAIRWKDDPIVYAGFAEKPGGSKRGADVPAPKKGAP